MGALLPVLLPLLTTLGPPLAKALEALILAGLKAYRERQEGQIVTDAQLLEAISEVQADSERLAKRLAYIRALRAQADGA